MVADQIEVSGAVVVAICLKVHDGSPPQGLPIQFAIAEIVPMDAAPDRCGLQSARGDVRAPAGFLFGKPIDIEAGHHNAVTDTDETPADFVLISPKFEGPTRRLQSAQYQRALSTNGIDD